MIDPERVDEIFRDCLFNDDEVKNGQPPDDFIMVEGITTNVGFHPGRVDGHREEIAEMLQELPREFRAESGGGMSFLAACNDKEGNQWTGLHQRMEQLFQLGIAIERVACCAPRDMWSALPGGVPYYVIKKEAA